MAKQTINYGTPPDGAGGDNRRAALEKLESNDTELYAAVAAAQADATAGLTAASLAKSIAGAASFKNKLLNGNFDHWQSGTSNAAHTANTYLADQWSTGGTGSTCAASQQAFAFGQTAVPNNPKFFHRVVVASVAGASNNAFLAQRIEFPDTLAGQDVTVSFWAKVDAAKSLAIAFSQNFGAGGGATVNTNPTHVIPIGTNWAYYSYTVSLPSVAGTTNGTNGYLAMYVMLDAGASSAIGGGIGQQSGTWDFAQFQLEAGDVATPFEMRAYGEELALCQRFCLLGTHSYTGMASVGTQYANRAFPVQMRAVPTIIASGYLDNDSAGTGGLSSVTCDQYGIISMVTASAATKIGRFYFTFRAEARL